jgi:hypothetical protein
MIKVFAQFWNLCIFRGSPVHVPSDNNALAILVLIIVGFSFVEALMLSNENMWVFFTASMVTTGVVLAAIYFALHLRGFAPRFRKTLAAYLGTLAITNALTMIVVGLSANNEVSLFLIAAFTLWRFAVIGFILKHSMEISVLAGALIAFACFLFASLVVLALFPAALAPVSS